MDEIGEFEKHTLMSPVTHTRDRGTRSARAQLTIARNNQAKQETKKEKVNVKILSEDVLYSSSGFARWASMALNVRMPLRKKRT
jgi:hypothetical protein